MLIKCLDGLLAGVLFSEKFAPASNWIIAQVVAIFASFASGIVVTLLTLSWRASRCMHAKSKRARDKSSEAPNLPPPPAASTTFTANAYLIRLTGRALNKTGWLVLVGIAHDLCVSPVWR